MDNQQASHISAHGLRVGNLSLAATVGYLPLAETGGVLDDHMLFCVVCVCWVRFAFIVEIKYCKDSQTRKHIEI